MLCSQVFVCARPCSAVSVDQPRQPLPISHGTCTTQRTCTVHQVPSITNMSCRPGCAKNSAEPPNRRQGPHIAGAASCRRYATAGRHTTPSCSSTFPPRHDPPMRTVPKNTTEPGCSGKQWALPSCRLRHIGEHEACQPWRGRQHTALAATHQAASGPNEEISGGCAPSRRSCAAVQMLLPAPALLALPPPGLSQRQKRHTCSWATLTPCHHPGGLLSQTSQPLRSLCKKNQHAGMLHTCKQGKSCC